MSAPTDWRERLWSQVPGLPHRPPRITPGQIALDYPPPDEDTDDE